MCPAVPWIEGPVRASALAVPWPELGLVEEAPFPLEFDLACLCLFELASTDPARFPLPLMGPSLERRQ